MKIYNISKSIKRQQVVLVLLGFIIFSIVVIKTGDDVHTTKLFLIMAVAIFAIMALWFYLSSQLEKIIIDENHLIYKKMFKKQIIIWKDIKEANVLDRWLTAPVIVLKGDGINLEIDHHSFANSEDLAKNILSHVKHIPVGKRYEFIEI